MNAQLSCLPLVLGLLVVLTEAYKKGEKLPFYSNKIGPYYNPSETYRFSDFPFFCQPEIRVPKSQSFGEKLQGDTKDEYDSLIVLKYMDGIRGRARVCQVRLDPISSSKVVNIISQRYYYEFVIDDIPVHGFVGYRTEKEETYLYTDYAFSIYVNPDEGSIIFANVTSGKAAIIFKERQQTLSFTYGVNWFTTKIPRSQRFEYIDTFFSNNFDSDDDIHKFALWNSVSLSMLMVGLVFTIVSRTVGKESFRFDVEGGSGKDDDFGWKVVHTDVFRLPNNVNLLAAIIGVGVQFLSVAVFVLFMSSFGIFHPGNDGALQITAIVGYALTSGIGGFTSAYWYKMLEGTAWQRNIITTASLFAGPFFFVALILDITAIIYGVTNSVPIESIIGVILIWGFIGLPLTVFGGITAKRVAPSFVPPTQPKNAVRELPKLPGYAQIHSKMAIAGFIGFSSIFTELYFIFNAIWGRSSFDIWGTVTIVFISLVIITAGTSVTLTYLHLSGEDYRWWWTSLYWGGSTGIYVLLYAIYFSRHQSLMSGKFQGIFYYGHQLLIAYSFFLMLGAVGFLSSFFFVRRIYTNIRQD